MDYLIDRLDQSHFKLYATVERGGFHTSDLELLLPTEDERVRAGGWAMTHDVLPGFRSLLESLGHANAAEA